MGSVVPSGTTVGVGFLGRLMDLGEGRGVVMLIMKNRTGFGPGGESVEGGDVVVIGTVGATSPGNRDI